MSSPIREIDSSRSIPPSRASRRAARNSFSGIGAALRVQEAVELLDRWLGALVGGPDDLVDLDLDLVADLLEFLDGGDLGLFQLVLEAHHRVALLPLLLLLLGAV